MRPAPKRAMSYSADSAGVVAPSSHLNLSSPLLTYSWAAKNTVSCTLTKDHPFNKALGPIY